MANRLWELRQRLEATREILNDLEGSRYETAHGWGWSNKKDQQDYVVLKKREAELLKEISSCR